MNKHRWSCPAHRAAQDDASALFYLKNNKRMTFAEQFKTVARLHHLIKGKATGTPAYLAQKLEISRSSVYNYLEALKELGAEIKYCRTGESFYYAENFDLVF